MSRYSQLLVNNGFDGYELAPSFGEVDIAALIGIVPSLVGTVGGLLDGPRKAQADLEMAKLQGASAERIAKLRARAEELTAQANAAASAVSLAKIPKDNTPLYVGIGAALVALFGIGIFVVRRKK